MPTTHSATSQNCENLNAELRKPFEQEAGLDFGICRILGQRHRDITEFPDKHLERTVRDALWS